MLRPTILACGVAVVTSLATACRAPDEGTYSDVRTRDEPKASDERVPPAFDEAPEAIAARGEGPEPAVPLDIDAVRPGDLDNTARFDPGHGQARQAFVQRADLALAQLEGELGMLDAQVAAMSPRPNAAAVEMETVRLEVREAKSHLERIRVGAPAATEMTRDDVAEHIDAARRALLSARRELKPEKM